MTKSSRSSATHYGIATLLRRLLMTSHSISLQPISRSCDMKSVAGTSAHKRSLPHLIQPFDPHSCKRQNPSHHQATTLSMTISSLPSRPPAPMGVSCWKYVLQYFGSLGRNCFALHSPKL